MNDFLQPASPRGAPARFFDPLNDLSREIVRAGSPPDNLSGDNGQVRAAQPRFGLPVSPKRGVTLLPLPTGRKFSKKFFIFFPTGRNLAQISLDNSLLVIVRCSCDGQDTEQSWRAGPEERGEGLKNAPGTLPESARSAPRAAP